MCSWAVSEDSCQLSKLWSSTWLCHWNSVWFTQLWGTPVCCALLVKEEVSKKKEVLTTSFHGSLSLRKNARSVLSVLPPCAATPWQHSFHICVLEQGRACTECTHQLFPCSWGWLGMFPKGCQAVFQTCRVSSLVLSWFSCQGLAPCWGWMARNKARNVVKGSLMGTLKGLAHGRKRQEFIYCHWWVSFSRGNLSGLYLVFPFFSQTWTPLFKQRTFLQQVLADREKCAGGDIKSLCRRTLPF